jgi:hypothetical protein
MTPIDATLVPADAAPVVQQLPSCHGATPLPAGVRPCRSRSDCPNNEECDLEGPWEARIEGCGAPRTPPPNECENDGDCKRGLVCESQMGECWAHSARRCVPGCPRPPCEAGDRCIKHRCEPIACTAGWKCGPRERCDANASDIDVHGCSPIPCKTHAECGINMTCDAGRCDARQCSVDTDCDCGGCVDGWCRARLGGCVRVQYAK